MKIFQRTGLDIPSAWRSLSYQANKLSSITDCPMALNNQLTAISTTTDTGYSSLLYVACTVSADDNYCCLLHFVHFIHRLSGWLV